MEYDPSQEVRFAVVMYGGVSLAVYMNGVAQELLRAVRATAKPDGTTLLGSELAYQEIGRRLFWGRQPGDTSCDDNIQTRIVVDILSGTSAGGINAVFLAKALALISQDLNNLRDMWLEKADLDTLLNDAQSDLRNNPTKDPKASLLNSTRMYELLLNALNNMNEAQDSGMHGAPLADQIDLFVTATDLNGLEAPIELTDKSADEKINRMMFHFHADGGEAGDFDKSFNRMLAFAARCTSSFPVAFEPMSFGAIQPNNQEKQKYQKFFERYVSRDAEFESRPFADGGILDNKPFSYAIDAIEYRDTSRPVLRKLLFLDPSPEHASPSGRKPSEFDFVENAMAALVTLPEYQTIREDIERINDRNRYLLRLETLRRRLRQDRILHPGARTPVRLYGSRDLHYMINTYGPSYAPYHHMKVFDVSDWLARLVTRVMGFNLDSDELRAIGQLVRVWREDHYAARYERNMKTENRFLLDFDIEYRIRRLHYIRDEVDERLKGVNSNSREGLWRALRTCRRLIQERQTSLFQHRQDLESPDKSPIRNFLQDPGYRIDGKELIGIIEPPTEDLQRFRAEELYRRLQPMFESAAAALASDLRKQFEKISTAMLPRTGPHADGNPAILDDRRYAKYGGEAQAIIRELFDGYQAFESHDCVMLPLLAGTDVTETGQIEIFRVSPADANLRPNHDDDTPERKLAGVKLAHFGAFLSKEWRQNDIMWGRLDGAERIISALLPDPRDKERRVPLIAQAQAEILKEELSEDVLFAWLAQYVKNKIGTGASEPQLKTALQSLVSAQANDPAIGILQDLLGVGSVPNYDRFVKQFYQMPSDPPPDNVLQWTGRAATIVSSMFQGLDKDRRPGLAAVGSKLKVPGILLTQLVRFAIPKSLLNVLARYLLGLLFLASILLIVAGPFESAGVAAAGWSLLFATTALAVVIRILADYLAKGSWWKWPLVTVSVVAGVLFLVVFGAGVNSTLEWYAHNRGWFIDLPHKLRTLWR
jgi:patatin-related protein